MNVKIVMKKVLEKIDEHKYSLLQIDERRFLNLSHLLNFYLLHALRSILV